VEGALAASFIATVVMVSVCALGLRGAVAVRVRNGELAAPAARSGLAAAIVGSTAFAALTNVDVIAAKAVLSDDDAGAYAAAALVGKLVLVAAAGVTIVLLPRVTVHLVSGSEHAAHAIRRSLAAVLVLGLATAAVVAPVPESTVLWLFGSSYGGARDLLAPCALAMTLAAIVQVMFTVSLAAGDHRYIAALAGCAVLDVVALFTIATTGLEILAVTAFCAGVAVIAYELCGPVPVHRLLRRHARRAPPTTT
jgi:O-antigen/teichoic acid export membrane protein